MLQLIKKLLGIGATKSGEIIETTAAPPPSPSPDSTTNIEAEPATEIEAPQTQTQSETIVIDSTPEILPPPLPIICEPQEVDLYKPSEKETQFAEWLSERIIGQPSAIQALVSAYRAYLNPIRNPNKPICTLMFAGPSRTGKTLCAQRLAEYFHGRRDAYIKVDGGDYMDKSNLTKLVGASAQWVGYQKPHEKIPDGAMDTSALLSAHNLISSRKGSTTNVTVVLIDEIEKACAEFFQFFLAILDVANATMGNNTKVDYSRCIFIMTSNLGMDRVEKEMAKPIGLGAIQQEIVSESRIASLVDRCMKERFLPEFRNRIDSLVIFSHLTTENLRRIVDVEISDLEKHLHSTLDEKQFQLEIDASAREFLLTEALKSKGNVANLKRVLNQHLSSPLGTGLINNVITPGQTVGVTHTGAGRLTFSVSGSKPAEVVQPPLQVSKEVAEAKKLWEQASHDYDAKLFDLAISNLRKAIDILESAGSNTHALRLANLYNRVGVYYENTKQSSRGEQIAAYNKALALRLQATTKDNVNELTEALYIYGNLGAVYSWNGENEKSKALLEDGFIHLKEYSQAYKNSASVSYFLYRYAQIDCSKVQELFEWALAQKITT